MNIIIKCYDHASNVPAQLAREVNERLKLCESFTYEELFNNVCDEVSYG